MGDIQKTYDTLQNSLVVNGTNSTYAVSGADLNTILEYVNQVTAIAESRDKWKADAERLASDCYAYDSEAEADYCKHCGMASWKEHSLECPISKHDELLGEES